MFIVLINDRLMILTHLIIFHFGQICQPLDGEKEKKYLHSMCKHEKLVYLQRNNRSFF